MADNSGANMAKWIGIAVIAIAIAVAAWFLAPSPTNDSRALVGGPFSLVNQDGERVTEQDFQGRYLLIYFGYTYCPDVCPVDLHAMSAALDMIDAHTLSRVQPVFVTIDPERDTVDVVRKYVSLFHPKLIGLTGTEEEIAAAAKAYRVFRRKIESEEQGEYLMDHSAITFLMDPDGGYLAHFSTGFTPEAMAARLESLVK